MTSVLPTMVTEYYGTGPAVATGAVASEPATARAAAATTDTREVT